MRVLVTGGTNFVGSHITNRLLQLGHEVIVTGRRNKTTPEQVMVLYPSLIGINRDAIGKIDVLYHCEGLYDPCVQDELELERANAQTAVEIFQYVVGNCGCRRIIYTSSVSIYGNTLVPFQEHVISPTNYYGRSMQLLEDAVEILEANVSDMIDVVFVGLRLANPYGPGESLYGREPSMVFRIAKELRSHPPILFQQGDIQRDFIYIDDVVSAFIKALQVQQSIVVNCGSGESISYNELFYLIRRVLKIGQSWDVPKYIPNNVKDMQEHTWCDMSLAWQSLNFKPAYSIAEGLKAYKGSGHL